MAAAAAARVHTILITHGTLTRVGACGSTAPGWRDARAVMGRRDARAVVGMAVVGWVGRLGGVGEVGPLPRSPP